MIHDSMKDRKHTGMMDMVDYVNHIESSDMYMKRIPRSVYKGFKGILHKNSHVVSCNTSSIHSPHKISHTDRYINMSTTDRSKYIIKSTPRRMDIDMTHRRSQSDAYNNGADMMDDIREKKRKTIFNRNNHISDGITNTKRKKRIPDFLSVNITTNFFLFEKYAIQQFESSLYESKHRIIYNRCTII